MKHKDEKNKPEQDVGPSLAGLRERARSLAADLPFFTGIEEFLASGEQTSGRNGAKQMEFFKEKDNGETALNIAFGADGRLVHYAAERALYASDTGDRPTLAVEQLRAVAEAFARTEYPDFPAGFDGRKVREYAGSVTFVYPQLASGIPLPESGFRIEVDRAGFVSVFIYEGSRPEPLFPEKRYSPEQALRIFSERLTLKLGIHFLGKELYGEDGGRLHLVYMAEPYAFLLPAEIGKEQDAAAEKHAPDRLPAGETSRTSDIDADLREGYEQAMETVRSKQPELVPFLLPAPGEDEFPPESVIRGEEDGQTAYRFAVSKNNLPVFKRGLEASVTVCLDRQDGSLSGYFDSDIDPQELAALPTVPALSSEEARLRLLESVHVKPVWVLERTHGRNKGYRLNYRLEDWRTGRQAIGVDAASGRILTQVFFYDFF